MNESEEHISSDIAVRIGTLMGMRGLSRKEFADAMGKRPSEVTKWLSGHHNFTISTIAKISAFFGQPIIVLAEIQYTPTVLEQAIALLDQEDK